MTRQSVLSPAETADFRKKLRKMFATLRKAGFTARMNFMCCQSCAWAEIGNIEPQPEDVVFYHNQDNANIPDGYVYLAWSGNMGEIYKAISNAGLYTDHDGNEDRRIRVMYMQKLEGE